MSSYSYAILPPGYGKPEIPGMAKGSNSDKLLVGKRLKTVRKALGLTGKTLAGMIGLGCTEQKISNYEKGRDGMPRLYVERLWATTGADFNYMYGGSVMTLPPPLREKMEKAESEEIKAVKKRKTA